MRAIEWADGDIVIIDQTSLPDSLEFRTLRSTDDVAEAIRSLRVRGAPALGIVGAMGVAQAALHARSTSGRVALDLAEEAGARLIATRPTAVNLAWAIDRLLTKARGMGVTAGAPRLQRFLVDEALAIQDEDERACQAMAKHAREFFAPQAVVMTHCNTGFLCTGGYGTALGAIRQAHEDGLGVAVIATETRPLLQGARLTAWELGRLGVPHAVVVDGAAPGLIARGEVSLVIVGADRIAANGDVANKVGTYPLALAAREAGVPFVVVAPTSTVDLRTRSGADIDIEERDPEEVTSILGAVRTAPPGSSALNPAFDVTPAALVSAIVTERGLARPPLEHGLRALLDGSAPRRARAAAAKKPSARAKPAAKKPAAKKPAAKKPAAKKPAAKKPAAKKPAAKKPAAAKATSRARASRTATRKSAAKPAKPKRK